MRLRRPALTSAALALTLAASMGATLAGTAQADSTKPAAHASKKAAAAQRALDVVEDAVAGRAPARDLTSAYRQLFVNRSALRGDDAARAASLLQRPTTPPDDPDDPRDIYYGPDADLQSKCGLTYCLHWVEEGEHAATPEFADEVFDTIRRVAVQYAAAGLKLPLPDQGQEGSTKLDIYLGELDEVGALGFCRTESPTPTVGNAYSAYCGIDNDFETYGGWLGLMNVTVAHEYFHAVQFAYDAEDAGWIYESTAAWIEDEVFDDVNDSSFFLNFGQMGDPNGDIGYPFAGPTFPLDVLDDFGGFNTYGNWGFWRYLTEAYPTEQAGIPTLVRDFWRALDTTAGPNPTTARQALDKVLAQRRTSTPDEYAGFATANQDPAAFYEEGDTYPTAPDGFGPVALSASTPQATQAVTLDHLTSATGVLTPYATDKNLQVSVQAPAGSFSRVAATVHGTDGSVSVKWIKVSPQGKGTGVVPFQSNRVASVEVTVANGGTLDGQTATLTFRAV